MIYGKKPEFSYFFYSTLIGKNNSLRVERHDLLCVLAKSKQKAKITIIILMEKPHELNYREYVFLLIQLC